MKDNTLSSKKKDLIWLSAFYFIISVLVVRFIINLLTVIALKLNNIAFEYRLFGHIFHSQGGSQWTSQKIFLIYVIIPAIVLILGVFLFKSLKANKKLLWKERLFLTWLAFVMVFQFPFRFIAGTFLFSGFGFAYITFIPSLTIRIILSLFVVIIAIILRPGWIHLFLKTSFTLKTFDDLDSRKQFLLYVLVYPWIAGLIPLTLFALTGRYWEWLIMLVSMGLVITPYFNNIIPLAPPKIRKSDKVILSGNRIRFYHILILAVLLYLSTIGV